MFSDKLNKHQDMHLNGKLCCVQRITVRICVTEIEIQVQNS